MILFVLYQLEFLGFLSLMLSWSTANACGMSCAINVLLMPFFFIQNFAVELQIETPDELNYDFFREAVHKAGGANYGTGVREL